MTRVAVVTGAARGIGAATVRALAASFSNALHDADQAIAGDVLDLALQLAKGMLKTALQIKPELVLPVVRDAIEYLPVLQQPALLVLRKEP